MEPDPLPHPHQAVPATGASSGARAVVRDVDLERVGEEPEPDPGGGRSGVLQRVGQRLLDHPVRRDLHRLGEWPSLALHHHVDTQPRPGELGDELVEPTEPGPGSQVVALVGVSEVAEEAVHLVDRLSAGSLDGLQRLRRLLGATVHHVTGGTGLHAHDAHMVGNHVVGVACDADPLLEHGAAGVGLPLALQLLSPLGKLPLPGVP